jgi:hypothetical protein
LKKLILGRRVNYFKNILNVIIIIFFKKKKPNLPNKNKIKSALYIFTDTDLLTIYDFQKDYITLL